MEINPSMSISIFSKTAELRQFEEPLHSSLSPDTLVLPRKFQAQPSCYTLNDCTSADRWGASFGLPAMPAS